MDLYTLTPTFMAADNIDEFVSAIWTERYWAAGDFQLVLPLTAENILKTKPGTYLALRGTKEVMEVRTQKIESGLLTVIGNSLIGFLNERLAWFENPDATEDNDDNVADLKQTTTPGEIIAHAVDLSVINPVPFGVGTIPVEANLQWDDEVIPGLELGAVDSTGVDEDLVVTVGKLYDSIAQVAQKNKVGISLYLESADAIEGYVLKFTTYRGVDHTTGGVGDLIRLTPTLESMSDIKEVRSNAYLKNVAYVYYKGEISVHYADPLAPVPTGMDRRVLITDPDKEPVGHKIDVPIYLSTSPFPVGTYQQTVTEAAPYPEFRAQNAKDALANANYIQAVDGQTSPHLEYKFGTDYGLGDLLELEGLTGILSKARVTEYIRSQDAQGEREYPTIAVEVAGEEEV